MEFPVRPGVVVVKATTEVATEGRTRGKIIVQTSVRPVFVPLAVLGVMVMSQVPMRAGAQATPVAHPATAWHHSVTGVGEVIVTPDTANIQIGVQVFSEELADAQRKSNEQIQAIIDTLKAAGIKEKDIQTSNYSVSIRQQYDNQGIATAVSATTSTTR